MRIRLISAAAIGLGMTAGGAIALDARSALLLTEPLSATEITNLEEGAPPTESDWVTANTISQTGLTQPSLWWAKRQYGGKLLTNWLARPESETMPSRVDLLVNQQVWSNYNYLDRYAFLNQVGNVSKDFGYSTRVFNAQGELLGAYICEFPWMAAGLEPEAEPTCAIYLDPSGQGAVRGTAATGALRAIGGGIGR